MIIQEISLVENLQYYILYSYIKEKQVSNFNLMTNTMEASKKQIKYIKDLANNSSPLQDYVTSNEHTEDQQVLKDVEKFVDDCKEKTEEMALKVIDPSQAIDGLKAKKNGFLAEYFPKEFAKIVDQNNQNGTFNKIEPWWDGEWVKHSKTIDEVKF